MYICTYVLAFVNFSSPSAHDTARLSLIWMHVHVYLYRPVEKTCLIKFQDIFDALKDVLCPPGEDDVTSQQLALEKDPQLPGVESHQQQQQQRTSQLLLLYSQCLSSFVPCFSSAMEEREGERKRERESGELSPPATHILQILM